MLAPDRTTRQPFCSARTPIVALDEGVCASLRALLGERTDPVVLLLQVEAGGAVAQDFTAQGVAADVQWRMFADQELCQVTVVIVLPLHGGKCCEGFLSIGVLVDGTGVLADGQAAVGGLGAFNIDRLVALNGRARDGRRLC